MRRVVVVPRRRFAAALRVVATARWVVLACLALGCNSLLGIEEHDVVRKSPVGTGDAAPCSGDGCPAACSETTPCPGDQRCVDGLCESGAGSGTGGGGTSGVGGASGSDAPIDSGMDGSAGTGGSTEPDSGPDQPMPECEGDGLRCEGAAQIQRSQCSDGQWKAIEACENGELCDSTTGECEPVVAGCSGREPGAAFCTGRERVVCGPDLVTDVRETCPTIEHCQGSVDGKCLPCVANEHKCEGNQLLICNADRNGFDLVTTCDDAPCNADLRMCTTQVCSPDTYTCNTASNTLRLCNADGSAYLQETPCNDGICDAIQGQCDVCAPNEFSCMSATEVLTCDRDGQQQTMQPCTQLTSASTPLCNDVKDACVACIAPSSSCVDRTREQACTEDGTWASPTACANQTCYQGKCSGECGPSVAPRCATAGGSESCGDDGEWHAVDSAAQCPVCIGDGMCVACTTGQTRCDSTTHQSTCVSNAWDISTPCSNKTCVGTACTGECSPGQQQCRSDGRYTCNPQGMFARAEPCSMCQMEGTTARCVTCRVGDYLCMGMDLHRCNSTQTGWEFLNRCDSPVLCNDDPGTAGCTDQDCSPTEVKCVGNELQTCNATGSAHSTMTCSGTFNICDAVGNNGNGQCDRCKPGDPLPCASSTQRTVCGSDGQTVSTPTCPAASGTPACYDGNCAQCNPTATPTMCEGLTGVRTCNGGTWSAATTCTNKTCTDDVDNCFGECAQGQARCTGPGSTIRETCRTNGFFGDGAVCSGIGAICTGAGVCRECANGATRCDGAGRQFTCTSNSWGTSFNCTNKTCFGDSGGVGGSCQGSCAPGQRRCVPGQRAFANCGSNGEPDNANPIACGGTLNGTSWEVCRSNACVDSAVTDAGYTERHVDGTWTVAPLAANQWRIGTIVIPAGLELKVFELRAILSNVPAGRSIRMALWNEVNSGGAQPGALVAYTSITGASNGLNGLPITASVKPQLTPGARYWIGINISSDEPDFSNLAFRQGSGNHLTYGLSAGTVPTPSLDPFPDVPVTSVGTTDYAMYILGKDAL